MKKSRSSLFDRSNETAALADKAAALRIQAARAYPAPDAAANRAAEAVPLRAPQPVANRPPKPVANRPSEPVALRPPAGGETSPAAGRFPPLAPPDDRAGDEPLFDFGGFLAWFNRAKLWIALSCAAVGLAGFLMARQDMQSSPVFTSATDIQIFPGDLQLEFARKALGGSRDAQTASVVRSLTEELTGDGVLARAVEIAFAERPAPEVAAKRKGPLSRWSEWLNYGQLPEAAADPLAPYREALTIDSIDGSFVMRISASMGDPQSAADLANAVYAAYSERRMAARDEAREALRASYAAKIEDAREELDALIRREIELDREVAPAAPVAAAGAGAAAAVAAAPSVKAVAELRANLQNQDALVRSIGALRSELVTREIDNTNLGGDASVLRRAVPPVVPDGATPLMTGFAYAVGFFLFLIGVLVLGSSGSALARRMTKAGAKR
ncbi:hypothetical protein [Paragemmobacter straminiformis]|uniref:Chain length determinant protein n=1 Tax=Paragemmobacter straminiformis TaxID=2045119 RepID=A0A842I763_9RHOB|nr:hypothetical protein [Gemmobacter straminiformis]MBC2835217.1 hypothetical protein [Gemmobacter straminiformis]